MIKQALADHASSEALSVLRGHDGAATLGTERYQHVHGVFRAVTNSGAETQAIVTPDGNSAIMLTDLIVTTDKTAGSSVIVRFMDGNANTVTIVEADTGTLPLGLAIPFQGRWQGWQGAWLELVTDTVNQAATVAVGYFQVGEANALPFAEWDALR